MKNIFNKLIRYIEEEDILGLVRYCLILLPFIAIFIVALYCMVAFVTRHKEGLIIIFIGVCFLCSSIMHIPRNLRIRSRGTERHSA